MSGWISRWYDGACVKLARGPRPWPIWVFALSFAGFAVYNLVYGLRNIEASQAFWEFLIPDFEWGRDEVIVVLSARFTIVMIPVVAIWAFASRLARLLVAIMLAFSAPGAILQTTDMIALDGAIWRWPLWWLLGMAVLVGLLFLPRSSYWLKRKGQVDAEIFD